MVTSDRLSWRLGESKRSGVPYMKVTRPLWKVIKVTTPAINLALSTSLILPCACSSSSRNLATVSPVSNDKAASGPTESWRVDHGGDCGAEQAADGVGVHEAGRVRHGLRRDDRGHGEGGDDVAGKLFERVLGQPLQDLQSQGGPSLYEFSIGGRTEGEGRTGM